MKKVIIASGPVIVKNNKVLLNISGSDDFWKYCGGRPKENASLMENAKARVKIEMGVDVEIKDQEPYVMYTKKPGEESTEVILVHFFATTEDEVKPGDMVKEWAWHDIDKLPENLGPNIIPALKHFGFIK